MAAVESATLHLIHQGRHSIATIAGPQDMPPGVDRLAGWRKAMAAHGLDQSLVEFGDFAPQSGTAAMRRLLERGVPIDALFAANDQMAAGAYSAILEAGLSIPDDIAVVGFDDDSYAKTTAPPLTTVHQPSVKLGATMAEVLVKRIEGEPVDHVTILPAELVIRQST